MSGIPENFGKMIDDSDFIQELSVNTKCVFIDNTLVEKTREFTQEDYTRLLDSIIGHPEEEACV